MPIIKGTVAEQSLEIKQEKLALMKERHKLLSIAIPRIEHEIEAEKKRLAEVTKDEAIEHQSCPTSYNPPLSPHDTSIL